VWPVGRSLTLRAAAGVYRQAPGFTEVSGLRGTRTLRPQRAYDADIGLEGRMSATSRWQVIVYDREHRDLLRLPGSEPRLVRGAFVSASITSRYANALDGYGRGIELLVQRRASNGLSGWASYSYGFTRDRDVTTGEAFWDDFDQRHTFNVYGNYRLTDRLSLSARFRAGSNFPAPGYWQSRGAGHALGSERNTVRVPPYSRLDVRANRTYTWAHTRLTLFLEGLNVYARSNVRFGIPDVNRRTLEVTHLFDTLAPFVPSAGILLEF
jgi:ferric enterobactin receptor